MSNPRFLRPMLLLGSMVLALSVFSFLALPDWRFSPGRLVILGVCAGIGLLAVVYDLIRLGGEIKRPPNQKP